MNHPSPEQWVQYVYGESPAKTELEQHLRLCPECHARVEMLKATGRQLDSWEIPPYRHARKSFLPIAKWAVAACVVLSLGFAAGRITAKPDANAIRSAVVPELREQLKKEVAQMVREEIANSSATTLATAADNADKVAASYAKVIYASLKKDVDTVALHADAGLRTTALKLDQLTEYQPTSLTQ